MYTSKGTKVGCKGKSPYCHHISIWKLEDWFSMEGRSVSLSFSLRTNAHHFAQYSTSAWGLRHRWPGRMGRNIYHTEPVETRLPGTTPSTRKISLPVRGRERKEGKCKESAQHHITPTCTTVFNASSHIGRTKQSLLLHYEVTFARGKNILLGTKIKTDIVLLSPTQDSIRFSD